MSLYSFRFPDIGEGIAEAEIVAWHVAVGDRIKEDAPLADMMTDKATVEMESPVAGVVVKLAGAVGDMVAIGAPLAIIETESEVEGRTDADHSLIIEPASAASAREVGAGISPDLVEPSPAPVSAGTSASAEQDASPQGQPRPILASPAVRARARDMGIDLADVITEGDRIRHADLDAFLRYHAGQGYLSPQGVALKPDQQIKIVGLRRKIAENMAAAKRAIPHFTYVEEIDVTALEALRGDLNDTRGERPKLTVLPLLIAALCRALPDFPMINARYDDEAGVVTQYGAVHLGIATQTQSGLMVPVIRDAQSLNIWQLANEVKRLSEAARNGKITPRELNGGTLTLTSLGPLGGISTTPVINRPEVAIIGPNKIMERAVFSQNAYGVEDIRKAKVMNLSISCDHRVIDGWDAANFVQAVKALLEKPVQLFHS